MTDSNKSVSPLRRRMIGDMTLRKLNAKTEAAYVRAVKNFTRFFGRSPELAEPEDLRRFQLQMVEKGVSSTTLNATITGLKFFYGVTLDRPLALKKMSPVRQEQKLPRVLSVEADMASLEVADIFRDQGPAWRRANAGHLSLGQLKVMSAIEHCRSAALGGHLLCCKGCAEVQIAYNSCRNRHCPKCQGSAARRWLENRQADLLPVDYYHVVFTLPVPISDIAYQNKAVIYNLLFKAAAETLLTIAADPKHLGARLGITAVLHTWGSALTHHPHIHCIVPGGGLSLDGERWVACKPGFFLPVRVLSRLFRRLLLEKLSAAYHEGSLQFFGKHQHLADGNAFARYLSPLHKIDWVVYAKRPFAGPEAVLAYLSRYTHRVAISNSRLIACDQRGVTFKCKDLRSKRRDRYKTMTLTTDEFMRRFLIHVLPRGFHRIRHYGLLANHVRVKQVQRLRQLLSDENIDDTRGDDLAPKTQTVDDQSTTSTYTCRTCGAPMIIIETFEKQMPRAPPVLS